MTSTGQRPTGPGPGAPVAAHHATSGPTAAPFTDPGPSPAPGSATSPATTPASQLVGPTGAGRLCRVFDVPEALVAALSDLYDSELAYHHVGHAFEVATRTQRLCRVVRSRGLDVAQRVCVTAALLHDARYRDAPAGLSREQHSAAVATDTLPALGYSTREVTLVASTILATECGRDPETLEGHLVRAADLAPLAAPYTQFRTNTELLRVEAAVLSGALPAPRAWADTVADAVGGWLKQPIFDLPSCQVRHRTTWHELATRNLQTYLAQRAD